MASTATVGPAFEQHDQPGRAPVIVAREPNRAIPQRLLGGNLSGEVAFCDAEGHPEWRLHALLPE